MTQGKIKIAVISHALIVESNRGRWKKLAEDKRYEVHLIVPRRWKSRWFGKEVVFETKELHSDNFHIHTLQPTDEENWGRYFLKGLCRKISEIKPDVIYVIHEESSLIHHQVYLCNLLNLRRSKIIFFSMNALGVPHKRTKNPVRKFIWWLLFQNIKLNTDAALVHYPGCLKSLREGGYKKPVYIQTQIGVDEEVFRPNPNLRKKYRKKLGIRDTTCVIGYCGRLTKEKGVDDIVDVFSDISRNRNVALLLVGDGPLRNWIEEKKMKNKKSKIIITGFVPQEEVPSYLNAMDIFVIASKTTPYWIDTFPLAPVQAQAVGLPVVASDSGALPWQLGNTAKIFPEGDKNKLKEALTELIENKKLREKLGELGRKRAMKLFSQKSLTENFKKIVEQVISGNFIYHSQGEPYTQWKAY